MLTKSVDKVLDKTEQVTYEATTWSRKRKALNISREAVIREVIETCFPTESGSQLRGWTLDRKYNEQKDSFNIYRSRDQHWCPVSLSEHKAPYAPQETCFHDEPRDGRQHLWARERSGIVHIYCYDIHCGAACRKRTGGDSFVRIDTTHFLFREGIMNAHNFAQCVARMDKECRKQLEMQKFDTFDDEATLTLFSREKYWIDFYRYLCGTHFDSVEHAILKLTEWCMTHQVLTRVLLPGGKPVWVIKEKEVRKNEKTMRWVTHAVWVQNPTLDTDKMHFTIADKTWTLEQFLLAYPSVHAIHDSVEAMPFLK